MNHKTITPLQPNSYECNVTMNFSLFWVQISLHCHSAIHGVQTCDNLLLKYHTKITIPLLKLKLQMKLYLWVPAVFPGGGRVARE